MLRSRLWSVSPIALDSSLDRRRLGRRADRDLVRRTLPAVWAAILCFLILIASSSYSADHPAALTVVGLVLLFVFSFRLFLSRWKSLSDRSYEVWRNLYCSTLIMSAICWGSFYGATVWLYGIDHGTTLLLLACMLAIC